MSKVVIYSPAKSAMQSGKAKNGVWKIKFPATHSAGSYDVMGWTSQDDTIQQINLEFSNQEDAINYATKNGYDYDIVLPEERKITIRSYADNFK